MARAVAVGDVLQTDQVEQAKREAESRAMYSKPSKVEYRRIETTRNGKHIEDFLKICTYINKHGDKSVKSEPYGQRIDGIIKWGKVPGEFSE